MKATLAMALFGATLIAVPAMAQTQRPADQAPKASEAKAPALYQMKAGQWRASKLDGLDVYNPNNEKIGDISELIVDRNGKVEAVVIGVGGFLGMGEHQVAVPFEKVQWVDQPVQQRVSSTERTTTGSGTSTVTSPAPAGSTMNLPSTTSHTTTTVAPGTGEQTTTTTTEKSTSTAPVTTDRTAASTAERDFHPDHAVVAMTKDQLKALPEVRYSR